MSNSYYTPTGAPGNHASGSSAAIRAEFALIQAAFDRMPSFVGNGGKIIGINQAEDAFAPLASIQATPIGTVTPAAGGFTTLAATGAALVGGKATLHTTSGAYVEWNRSAGDGETSFLNRAGGGTVGGFNWGEVDAGNIVTPTMTLGKAGNLSVTGSMTAALGFVGNVTGNVSGNAGTATTTPYATFAASAGSASTAGSAGSVPWSGVTGRPTGLSQFINDAGFVTSIGAAAAGSLTGSTLAAGVTASSITSLGTLSALAVSGATTLASMSASGAVSIAGSLGASGGISSTVQINAQGNQGSGGLGVTIGGLGGILVQGPGGGNPAYMSFLRPAQAGGYFGIDTDNQLKFGGWSYGSNAWVILHSGNSTGYAPSPTGVGASGTWGINITGSAAFATTAGASNTANSATFATTSGACTGNSATATTASNVAGSGAATVATLTASGLVKGNGGGLGMGAITVSTSAPSGGSPGDIWFQY